MIDPDYENVNDLGPLPKCVEHLEGRGKKMLTLLSEIPIKGDRHK